MDTKSMTTPAPPSADPHPGTDETAEARNRRLAADRPAAARATPAASDRELASARAEVTRLEAQVPQNATALAAAHGRVADLSGRRATAMADAASSADPAHPDDRNLTAAQRADRAAEIAAAEAEIARLRKLKVARDEAQNEKFRLEQEKLAREAATNLTTHEAKMAALKAEKEQLQRDEISSLQLQIDEEMRKPSRDTKLIDNLQSQITYARSNLPVVP